MSIHGRLKRGKHKSDYSERFHCATEPHHNVYVLEIDRFTERVLHVFSVPPNNIYRY